MATSKITMKVGYPDKGTYSSSTTYGKHELVHDEDNYHIYRSKADSNTGNDLSDTDWWQLWVSGPKGEKGDVGRIEEIEDSTSTEVSMEIEPDVFYKFTAAVTSISLTFAEGESGYYHEYLFQFLAGASCALTLPDGVTWFGGRAPTLTEGNTYQVSVVNNFAVYGEF